MRYVFFIFYFVVIKITVIKKLFFNYVMIYKKNRYRKDCIIVKNKSVFRVIINKGIIICYIEREREKKRYRVKILLMYSRFLPLNYIFFI